MATGTGSLPGTDPGDAAAMVAGELPHWPHLVELPGRGPGADMVGRAMALLCEVSGEFAVQTSATGWQRTAAPGRDMRRASAFLNADLDAAAEHFAGYQGPFSLAVAGPWTLAATVEDQWGERALRDRGYVADLGAALAEAGTALVGRLRRAVPGASPVLVLDEPSMHAVHRGSIAFTSGYRRHSAVSVDELVAGLRPVKAAVGGVDAAFGLHTCAPVVWPVLDRLAPQWLSLDVSLLGESDTEAFGTWLERGSGTVWGVWPTSGPVGRDAVERGGQLVGDWLHRLGLAASAMPGPVAVSPRCGLAGTSRQEALRAMRGVTEIARRLRDTQ